MNAVYLFTCSCKKASYVGKSENVLKRIREHGQRSGNTPIYPHITECQEYQASLNALPNANTPSVKYKFLKSRFSVLHRKLTTPERDRTEALEIKLRNPNLNTQVTHKKQKSVHLV